MDNFVLDKTKSVSNFKNSEEAKNDLIQNYTNPGHPVAFSGVGIIYNYYNG